MLCCLVRRPVPATERGACANWLLFQRRQKEQREAKKAYLRYHMARCTQAVHQLESLQVRRQVW